MMTYSEDLRDEPWAWESREFLRKKLVGKDVVFVVDYKIPSSGREYGVIWLGRDMETGENITETMLYEGLVTVRRESKSDVTRLLEIEEAAKKAERGRWSTIDDTRGNASAHIRDIIWQVDNSQAQALVAKMGRKPISAVVEHVRDGSTIRVFLLPTYHYITVMMSGIRVRIH